MCAPRCAGSASAAPVPAQRQRQRPGNQAVDAKAPGRRIHLRVVVVADDEELLDGDDEGVELLPLQNLEARDGASGGWSSHGMTSSPGPPGNACAGPATRTLSPANAAPPPLNKVGRDMSPSRETSGTC